MSRDQPKERDLSAVERLVERLGLAPHPEGGFFREVYRAAATVTHPGIPEGRDARRARPLAEHRPS